MAFSRQGRVDGSNSTLFCTGGVQFRFILFLGLGARWPRRSKRLDIDCPSISHQKGMKHVRYRLSASVRQNLLSLQSPPICCRPPRTVLPRVTRSTRPRQPTTSSPRRAQQPRQRHNNLLDSIGNGVQVLQAAHRHHLAAKAGRYREVDRQPGVQAPRLFVEGYVDVTGTGAAPAPLPRQPQHGKLAGSVITSRRAPLRSR